MPDCSHSTATLATLLGDDDDDPSARLRLRVRLRMRHLDYRGCGTYACWNAKQKCNCVWSERVPGILICAKSAIACGQRHCASYDLENEVAPRCYLYAK